MGVQQLNVNIDLTNLLRNYIIPNHNFVKTDLSYPFVMGFERSRRLTFVFCSTFFKFTLKLILFTKIVSRYSKAETIGCINL